MARFAAAVVLSAVALTACTPASNPDGLSTPGRPTTRATPTPTPTPPTLEEAAPGLLARQKVFTFPDTPGGGPEISVDLTRGSDPVGTLASANVGLSFETAELADPRWEPGESTLTLLIKALDRPSLRFGGNSVDRRVWWTSSDEPAPDWAEAVVTPADLKRLARFVQAVDATVTLVVDLGHNDPERGADYVFHAREALGDALVAVSVGNEPNGFNLASQPQYRIRDDSWGPDAYVKQLRTYSEAIQARTPGVRLIGPGAFDAPWWRAFASAGLPETTALAQHWYPLWSCDGVKEPKAAPTVANLTDPWLRSRARFMLGMGLSTARGFKLPVWMEETGPTSCVGTNETSRTHAQALWTVEYTLHAASLGVQRMNHHGMLGPCVGGAPMSPTCDPAPKGTRGDRIRGQANYLALLQVGRLREGQFVPVRAAGNERVFAYAIAEADADGAIDLVLINMNDPAQTGASPLTLTLPEGATVRHASLLSASGLGVRNETTLIPWSPVARDPQWRLPAGSVLALRLTRG